MRTIFCSFILACLIFHSIFANAAIVFRCDKRVDALSKQFELNWDDQSKSSYIVQKMGGHYTGVVRACDGKNPSGENPHLSFLHVSVFGSHDMEQIACHYNIGNPEMEGMGRELIMSTLVTDHCVVIEPDRVQCE